MILPYIITVNAHYVKLEYDNVDDIEMTFSSVYKVKEYIDKLGFDKISVDDIKLIIKEGRDQFDAPDSTRCYYRDEEVSDSLPKSIMITVQYSERVQKSLFVKYAVNIQNILDICKKYDIVSYYWYINLRLITKNGDVYEYCYKNNSITPLDVKFINNITSLNSVDSLISKINSTKYKINHLVFTGKLKYTDDYGNIFTSIPFSKNDILYDHAGKMLVKLFEETKGRIYIMSAEEVLNKCQIK